MKLPQLTALNLSENKLTGKFGGILSSFKQKPNQIKTLNLDFNPLTFQGIQFITFYYLNNFGPYELHLRGMKQKLLELEPLVFLSNIQLFSQIMFVWVKNCEALKEVNKKLRLIEKQMKKLIRDMKLIENS